MTQTKQKNSAFHNFLTVLGIVMCIILIPILIINCTLLFKGYTQKDEVPSIGGIFPMIVLTDSMYPEFYGGDLIICKNLSPREVEVGDVITFFDPDGNGTSINTHRVLEVLEENGELSFITKGDNNNTADRTPVPSENLVGIYSGTRIPGAGNIAMFMQSTMGLIVCVVLPLVLLIGYDGIRRTIYNKQHQSDKDKLMAELEELRRLKAEMGEKQ